MKSEKVQGNCSCFWEVAKTLLEEDSKRHFPTVVAIFSKGVCVPSCEALKLLSAIRRAVKEVYPADAIAMLQCNMAICSLEKIAANSDENKNRSFYEVTVDLLDEYPGRYIYTLAMIYARGIETSYGEAIDLSLVFDLAEKNAKKYEQGSLTGKVLIALDQAYRNLERQAMIN